MATYNDKEITVQIGEVKEALSYYLTEVEKGKTITIVKGKKREPVAQLVAPVKRKRPPVSFDALANEGASVVFHGSWEMTEGELLGL